MKTKLPFGRQAAVGFIVMSTAVACSNGVPLGPSDAAKVTTTSSSSSSATPAPAPPPSATPAPTNVAYVPDLQPVFNSDCVPCHGNRSAAARYNMSSYAGVMAAVAPGSASSPLVIVTQPGGLMYSFFTGDRASKSAMVKAWVLAGAPQNR